MEKLFITNGVGCRCKFNEISFESAILPIIVLEQDEALRGGARDYSLENSSLKVLLSDFTIVSVNEGLEQKVADRNLWTTIANGKIWKGEIRNYPTGCPANTFLGRVLKINYTRTFLTVSNISSDQQYPQRNN